MTDKQALCTYRFNQAQETLTDAQKMLSGNVSPKSIVNRAYYAVFYSILALFLKNDVNLTTSKHTGVISIFDKDFVHTEKIDKKYSKILHKLFEARQDADYKELVEISLEEASEFVKQAEEFLAYIRPHAC